MKLKLARLSRFAPPVIAIGVIVLVGFLRVRQVEIFDRMERITYDMRVREALRFPEPVATNLAAVFITDDSIKALNNGSLGFQYGINWPRHVYGRTLEELSVEGARAVAFDVLFGEQHPRDDPVAVGGGRRQEVTNFLNVIHPGEQQVSISDQGEDLAEVESDDYFAWQLKRAGMAILAADIGRDESVYPDPLFATNAAAVGDISSESDSDGVLRRVRAFKTYRTWHAAFRQLEENKDLGVDLSKAEFEPGKIILPRERGNPIPVPVDADNNFKLAVLWGNGVPPGTPPMAKAFMDHRVWDMGIQLAARELGLDLEHADVDLVRGKITLRGPNGLQRTIPVDENGYFYINWEMTAQDPRLAQRPLEEPLGDELLRLAGRDEQISDHWSNKLVVVGSTATGNNLTDRGATPLEKNTFLVSVHWNVANSIIMGRFVGRASMMTELALIAVMGLLTALLTWRLGALTASASVLLLATAYYGVGLFLYVHCRYWLPLVLPIVGAIILQYILLVTYRYFFEEREKRRVRSIFSRLVSPNVATELIGSEKLELGGTRRAVSVLFADVRGFTEFTDRSHEQVEQYVKERQLTGAAAEACYDDSARETLSTVNLYLAQVADMVKKHNGTLDKYIGDCVMAFWGAPTPNPKHALACVQAAIGAQRAIHALNEQRIEANRQMEMENAARVSAGLPPRPLLVTLMLGTGINTGSVTVGLMGSEAHIVNYTVFGREVNLASRLEHESGRGRIVISEATFQHLLRDDPALAATCVPLEPVMVKGIRSAVKIYEVPWRTPEPAAAVTPGLVSAK